MINDKSKIKDLLETYKNLNDKVGDVNYKYQCDLNRIKMEYHYNKNKILNSIEQLKIEISREKRKNVLIDKHNNVIKEFQNNNIDIPLINNNNNNNKADNLISFKKEKLNTENKSPNMQEQMNTNFFYQNPDIMIQQLNKINENTYNMKQIDRIINIKNIDNKDIIDKNKNKKLFSDNDKNIKLIKNYLIDHVLKKALNDKFIKNDNINT